MLNDLFHSVLLVLSTDVVFGVVCFTYGFILVHSFFFLPSVKRLEVTLARFAASPSRAWCSTSGRNANTTLRWKYCGILRGALRREETGGRKVANVCFSQQTMHVRFPQQIARVSMFQQIAHARVSSRAYVFANRPRAFIFSPTGHACLYSPNGPRVLSFFPNRSRAVIFS